MAANHIAMVRSSARRAHGDPHQDDTMNSSNELTKSGEENSVTSMKLDTHQSLADELSQISVISIDESSPLSPERSHKSQLNPRRKSSLVPEPMVAKLRLLKTVSDIDDCVDSVFCQERILEELERNWDVISNQFATVVEHLTRSSKEVSVADVIVCDQP